MSSGGGGGDEKKMAGEVEENLSRRNSLQYDADIGAKKKKATGFQITKVSQLVSDSANSAGKHSSLSNPNDLDADESLDEDLTDSTKTEETSKEMKTTESVDTESETILYDVAQKTSAIKGDTQSRFKIIKLQSRNPYKKGRWTCQDFPDPPPASMNIEKLSDPRGDDVSETSSASDSSKNPINISHQLQPTDSVLEPIPQLPPADYTYPPEQAKEQQTEVLEAVESGSDSNVDEPPAYPVEVVIPVESDNLASKKSSNSNENSSVEVPLEERDHLKTIDKQNSGVDQSFRLPLAQIVHSGIEKEGYVFVYILFYQNLGHLYVRPFFDCVNLCKPR
ncbi:unnamed protein product [Dimorphilus gyrociliatus]|uniref:Uncharacterized protein n=1 Tax=Dimorphilus gyrociliatus TaxID=2664684 RepID=A0A7I8V9N2_9ANNE|nr:unnamed protein product [Dimorphilus gyrociliatus]